MKRPVAIGLAALAAAASCAGILGLRQGAQRPFEHRAHVLEGIACVECHAGVAQAGDQGPLHLPDQAACLRCHPQPHDPSPCRGCHGSPHIASDLMQARDHLRFSHAGHSELTAAGKCVECHGAVGRDDGPLRPTMGTCLGCHQHQDQFKVRDCGGCHVDLPAELTQPANHLIHDGDFLREHGARAASAADLCATCHKTSFCSSCHGSAVPGLPSRLAFDDPLRAGMHRAGFRARHAEEARAEPGLCATCHSEPTCRGCHTDLGVAGDGGRDPHPPGWVGFGTANEHGRAARRDPASCASCHGGGGELLCVSCHRVGGVGGNPHPPGWESGRSLDELPCRLCHSGPL